MKIRTLSMAALIASMAFGFGCSGGGGGGGGSASTAAGSTGQVSSGLPTPSRDSAGYSFNAFYTPSVNIKGGQISAMHVAPVGTQQGVLVADSPFSNVAGVASGTAAVFETKFSFDASSFATIGTQTYAATANRDAPGAGDLYVRDVNGNWRLAEDGGDNEMVVAAVGTSQWFAARGSIASPMKIKRNGAEVAAVNSARPTSAIGYKGNLIVGASFAGSTGGGASLYTLKGSALTQTKIPANGIGGGVFQEVTSMAVATVTSGSQVTGEFLFVAVGEFDINGTALSGSVMVSHDGSVFEHVANYNGDAPTSLAWVDSTIYVGSAAGSLRYRNSQGTMVDEPGLPSSLTGIQSLAVNGTDLYIGGSDSSGAVVFVRLPGSGSSTPTPPTPTPQDYFYNSDVAPILAAKCASCHNGGVPAAETAWPLASPANLLADHAELTSAGPGRIDLANPAASLFLQKATNDLSHVGGEVIKKSDPEYAVLLAWITQGAKFDNTVTPPAPVAKTFTADVFNLVKTDCMGCHAGGTGGYTANNNLTTSYNSAVSKTNQTPGQEEMSMLLRRAARTNGTSHTGGTIWPAGGAKYNAVLQWIKDGVQQ